ncbi:hypothetical protein [Francisella halioticida]|nr:hypothetical protein [Francisella halioticida]
MQKKAKYNTFLFPAKKAIHSQVIEIICAYFKILYAPKISDKQVKLIAEIENVIKSIDIAK